MKPITLQITVQLNPEQFWAINKKALENTAGNVGAYKVLHNAAIQGIENAGFSVAHAETTETKLQES